jgi:hypothetical protein
MQELNEQSLEALVKANRVRMARARDKQAIKRGALSPVQILREPPDHWQTAMVVDLLLAMHKVGRGRALRWLESTQVSPTTRLMTLSEARRWRLSHYVAYASPPQTPEIL